MAKSELDPDAPAYVAGQWYMVFAIGGFTVIGQFVKSIGLGQHRFAHATHLRNAGGMALSEICAKGPGPQTTFVPEFPGCFDLTVLHKTPYFGTRPWTNS